MTTYQLIDNYGVLTKGTVIFEATYKDHPEKDASRTDREGRVSGQWLQQGPSAKAVPVSIPAGHTQEVALTEAQVADWATHLAWVAEQERLAKAAAAAAAAIASAKAK